MKTLVSAMVLAAIVASAGDPINKNCPITGKEVAAGREVEYEKQLIGLCCMDCVGKFESDPKKYIGKVKEFKKKKASSVTDICCSDATADPINKKCPLSGKDVDKEQTSTYQEQVIGFCCGGCKGKFDKEPEKFVGKVKEFKKKSAAEEISFADPINKVCPITGKDVNPTKTVEYEKQVIGLCCMDCVGKFESDPKKYIGKVKEFKKKKS